MSWNRMASAIIKNCFVSARFCEAENNDELKTLKTPESVSDDMIKLNYETWMSINSDISISAKLTEIKSPKVCEKIHNNDDDDQEDDDT